MAVLDRPGADARPRSIASPRGTGGEASPLPDRVLMKGNEAIAEAAIAAGCDAYFGYPITPQAELLEWMARRMPEEGRAFVQAESELPRSTWRSAPRPRGRGSWSSAPAPASA